MGIWVLLPYHQRGAVTYDRNRWRIRGGGFMQAYMTIFGQEGLGRPDTEAAGQVQAVSKHLAARMDESSVPPINAVLVFTQDRAEVDSEGAPLPAVHVKKLKDLLRQKQRRIPLGAKSSCGSRHAFPKSERTGQILPPLKLGFPARLVDSVGCCRLQVPGLRRPDINCRDDRHAVIYVSRPRSW
jgi:hypothetical protein